MQRTRYLRFKESSQSYWKVLRFFVFCLDCSLTLISFYILHLSRRKRNMIIGSWLKNDTSRTSSMSLGRQNLFQLCIFAYKIRQAGHDPPIHPHIVTCHLCVLNAHRLHQKLCPKSTPEQFCCSCRPNLEYELYSRYDVATFLAHMKLCHLEYFEGFRDLLEKLSLQGRSILEFEKDLWEAQSLIRDVFGMGDDLI